MSAARASFIAAHALGWRLYDRSLMNHLGYSPQDSINSLLRSRVGGQDDTSKTKEASQEDASGVVLGFFLHRRKPMQSQAQRDGSESDESLMSDDAGSAATGLIPIAWSDRL